MLGAPLFEPPPPPPPPAPKGLPDELDGGADSVGAGGGGIAVAEPLLPLPLPGAVLSCRRTRFWMKRQRASSWKMACDERMCRWRGRQEGEEARNQTAEY